MSTRDWGRGGTGGKVGPGPWVRVLRAGCMVYPAWVVCLGGFPFDAGGVDAMREGSDSPLITTTLPETLAWLDGSRM